MGLYIPEKFRSKAIQRYGIYLFSAADALGLLEEARRENCILLGIDSFRITEEGIQPDMENSVNYSDAASNDIQIKQVYELANAFIVQREKKGFVFEIVLHKTSGV